MAVVRAMECFGRSKGRSITRSLAITRILKWSLQQAKQRGETIRLLRPVLQVSLNLQPIVLWGQSGWDRRTAAQANAWVVHLRVCSGSQSSAVVDLFPLAQ
jgi:hypothetical protein